MNKIIIHLLLLSVFVYSCAEDKEIGEIIPLTADHVLPQGKSPADDRIVELHEKYNSYFLYEFTKQDFEWTLISNSTLKGTYLYTLGDPVYAGDMLDLLNEIWFQFYPEDFLRKTIPYRVFLTSTLDWTAFGDPIPQYCRNGNNQIAINYCSDTLTKMSGTTKLEFKNRLQYQLWSSWMGLDMITFPEAFFLVSNYSTKVVDDVTSPNYARTRGFFGSNGYEWSVSMVGATWYQEAQLKSSDRDYFIQNMLQRTSEDLEAELSAYPLLKKKYDILREYFKETYGFDIKKIGDAVY